MNRGDKRQNDRLHVGGSCRPYIGTEERLDTDSENEC